MANFYNDFRSMFQFHFTSWVSLETTIQFWGSILPVKSLSHFPLFGVKTCVKPAWSRTKWKSLAKLFWRRFPVSHCLGQQQFQSLWNYVLTNLVSQRRKRVLIPVHSCQVLGLLWGACMRINYFKCYMWSLKEKEHFSEGLPGYHRIIESNH